MRFDTRFGGRPSTELVSGVDLPWDVVARQLYPLEFLKQGTSRRDHAKPGRRVET